MSGPALARHPDRLLVGLVVLGFAGSAWLTSGIDVVERLSSLHAGPDAGREQLQVLACLLVMAWLVAPLATTNRRTSRCGGSCSCPSTPPA
ncbi:MAG: hypothetical protein R2726_19060 [Acidimicrobiales bacterium]